jgi:hypothetical protein
MAALLEGELTKVMMIPGELVTKWPVIIGFGLINWMNDMIIGSLPFPRGGAAGTAARYGVEGIMDTTKALYGSATIR